MKKLLLLLVAAIAATSPFFAQNDFRVCVKTPSGQGIGSVKVTANYSTPSGMNSLEAETSPDGCASFPFDSSASACTFVFSKDNDIPVPFSSSLRDIWAMYNHILGILPIGNFSLIASDINQSGSVTTFDLVELRKFFVEECRNTGQSPLETRFVPTAFRDYAYNPFDSIQIPPPNLTWTPGEDTEIQVTGIGTGNVDLSTGQDSFATDIPYYLEVQEGTVPANTEKVVDFYASETAKFVGFQMVFAFDPTLMEVNEIILTNAGLENFLDLNAIDNAAGTARLMVPSFTGLNVQAGEKLFSLKIKTFSEVSLPSALNLVEQCIKPEAYLSNAAIAHPILIKSSVLGTVSSSNLGNKAAYPNPTDDNYFIPYRLETASSVRLQVFDAVGKLQFESVQEQGTGEFLATVPSNALKSKGMYFWKISNGKAEKHGTFVKN